jgi:hypothetical protein
MAKDNTKKGIAVGTALTGLGAGVYGLTKYGDKLAKPGSRVAAKKIAIKNLGGAKGIKALNNSGKIVGATGLAITGVSAYKHYKNKKKNDNPEK